MTIDNSLKIKSGSSRVRNVLKRGERIEQMKQEGRWTDGDGVLGLPKVRVQKIALKKKKMVKKEEKEILKMVKETVHGPLGMKTVIRNF